MKEYKEVTLTTRKISKYVCNKCGRDMKPGSNVCGLQDCIIYGGYDSPVLDDCTRYEFDLCEYCLQELFDSFKIPVEKKEIPI